jgi:primosomal protein N' (replication factor Y)
VTLVGVLCAYTGLSLPDFRASERTFQLLAQVAGRAGRGDRAGRVMIQTYRPTVPAVTAAAAHDYAAFFTAESAERAECHWPPHGRVIVIRIDGTDEHAVAGAANTLAAAGQRFATLEIDAAANEAFVLEVLGPVPAMIEKLRGRTRWQVVLRGTDRASLRRVARGLVGTEVPSSVRVSLDIDPMSML